MSKKGTEEILTTGDTANGSESTRIKELELKLAQLMELIANKQELNEKEPLPPLAKWDGKPLTVKNATKAFFKHVTIEIPADGSPYTVNSRDLESYYHVIKYAIDAGDLVEVTE